MFSLLLLANVFKKNPISQQLCLVSIKIELMTTCFLVSLGPVIQSCFRLNPGLKFNLLF